jgi:hypothetical protein
MNMFFRFSFTITSISLFFLGGCSLQSNIDANAPDPKASLEWEEVQADDTDKPLASKLQKLTSEPLTPEQTSELVDTAAGNFFYGPGLGETALDVAGMILFPPYALVVVGNSALSLAGYQPLSIKRVLPEDVKKDYSSVTDTIYSGPGRVVAGVSGKEYLKREKVKDRWDDFANKVEESRAIAKEKNDQESRINSQNP